MSEIENEAVQHNIRRAITVVRDMSRKERRVYQAQIEEGSKIQE